MSAPSRRRLASIEAGSEYIDVSARTLRRWISIGRITGYRVGPRLVRVDLNELDGLVRPIPAGETL